MVFSTRSLSGSITVGSPLGEKSMQWNSKGTMTDRTGRVYIGAMRPMLVPAMVRRARLFAGMWMIRLA